MIYASDDDDEDDDIDVDDNDDDGYGDDDSGFEAEYKSFSKALAAENDDGDDNYDDEEDEDDYYVEGDGDGNDGFLSQNVFLLPKAMTSAFKSHDFCCQYPRLLL